MSITVRLVFMGLIGFAPHPEGQKGMTALFVDPPHVQTEAARCLTSHYPVLYMFHGQCEGDCRRVPPKMDTIAKQMGFNNPNVPLELAWLIDKEDLAVSRSSDESISLKKPWLRKRPKVSGPKRAGQNAYFSWVPGMGLLTGGHGEVREDCLNDAGTCPISARFKVAGGRARACHLFHDVDQTPAKDGKSNVRIFEYNVRTDSGKPVKQAVADAVLVEIEVEGDEVELRSWQLPTGTGQQKKLATARLKPEGDSKTLTLIIANLPTLSGFHVHVDENHGDDNGMSHDHCEISHSDILTDLLAREPNPRPSRTLLSEPIRVEPGACEAEMTEVASLFQGEPPHSTTACDGNTFP